MQQYDVAISFAGEDRDTARALANELLSSFGLRVFYDDYEQAALWGKNLTEYLVDIYRKRARFCAVLVSRHYREKRWTRHEWRAAQARAFEEPDAEYILPVRLDDTELEGLLPTVGWFDLRRLSVRHVAQLIHEKVADFADRRQRLAKAQALYGQRQYRDALTILTAKDFGTLDEALRLRADVHGRLGQHADAVRDLQQVIALVGDDFLTRMLLGIYLFRAYRFQEAVTEFQRAEAMSPGHPTVRIDLAAAKVYSRLQRIPGLRSLLKWWLTRQIKFQEGIRNID